MKASHKEYIPMLCLIKIGFSGIVYICSRSQKSTMEEAGLVVSVIAISLSIFTYFKHDVKIKKQSKLINEYQIERLRAEKEKSQRAVIKSEVINEGKGSFIIRFSNIGEATAKELQIFIPKTKGVIHQVNPTPTFIRSHGSLDVHMLLSMAAPDVMDLEVKWKDEFNSSNQEIYRIQFP